MITLYNHETEQYLLGALLQDPELVKQLPSLPSDLMHDDRHAVILAAMQQLYNARAPVEIIAVSNQLNTDGRLDDAGGMQYLVQCYRASPVTANAGYYLQQLKQLAESRRAYMAATAFCRRLTDGEPLDASLDTLRTELRSMSAGGSVVRMPQMISMLMDDVERRSKGEVRMLKTGLPDLDAVLRGIEPVNFVLIGARPGVGKSAFAMQIAMNIARKGAHVLVCSREMSDIQYARRMVSNASGINGVKLKEGKVSDDEWARLSDAGDELAPLPISFLFDTATVEDLRRTVQQEKDRGRLDLVMVDYLQIMSTSQKTDKRYEEVGRISRALKDIALDLKVPVIAMAQVGRQTVSAGMTRAATMPALSDLRESGNLEQDADIIVFLHHPEGDSDPSIPEYDRDTRAGIEAQENCEYMVVNVAKNREAAKGSFGIEFDKAHQRFTCIQH